MDMRPRSILVIDDDTAVRDLLNDFLCRLGYRVITAATPGIGLERFQKLEVDLIITDQMMPGMSGIDLLKIVRSFDLDIPVVMITGYPSIDVTLKTMKEGASDFITKPFNLEHVKLVVKRAVEEGCLKRQNRALMDKVKETDRIRAMSNELQGAVKELSALYTISESLHYPFVSTGDLFKRVVELAASITESKKAGLWMMNSDSSRLILKASRGMGGYLTDHYEGNGGLVGRVFTERQYALSQDYRRCICADNNRDFKHSFMCMPIIIGNEVFAALHLCQKVGGTDYTRDDVALIENLAKKTSIKVENLALYENLINSMLQGVTSLVKAINAKDNYTMNHCKRVTLYAVRLAECLGCTDELVNALRFSGPIHDVGKIGIRDDILLKPGILGAEEREVIMRHVVIGESIIKPLNLGVSERAIVRYHHERFDGTGYPDGLSGEEIPLVARIFSVADTYDAMTTTRPYRSARSHEEAVEELVRCSASQFDKDVVDAFMDCCMDNFSLGTAC